MERITTKGSITLSRPHWGNGKEVIQITIKDRKSRKRFLTGEIDLNTFAKMMTGLSEVDIDLELHGLEAVGKFKETMKVEAPMPKHYSYHDRVKVACEAIKTVLPEGWYFEKYFGSKSSFKNVDGVEYCCTTAHRYVEWDDQEDLDKFY